MKPINKNGPSYRLGFEDGRKAAGGMDGQEKTVIEALMLAMMRILRVGKEVGSEDRA